MVAEHGASARRVATVVLGTATDADDVVQVASLRAMAALHQLDDRPFRSWYLRIVANCARNHLRSRGRRRRAEVRLAARGPTDDALADPALDAVSHEQRTAVVSALNRLRTDDRLIIALRHFEQMSEQDMATTLDCATGTVKSRLARAMARLRTELETNNGGRR